jgi:hypothetical protein
MVLRLAFKLCTDICLQVNNYQHGDDTNPFEVKSEKFKRENPLLISNISTKMK